MKETIWVHNSGPEYKSFAPTLIISKSQGQSSHRHTLSFLTLRIVSVASRRYLGTIGRSCMPVGPLRLTNFYPTGDICVFWAKYLHMNCTHGPILSTNKPDIEAGSSLLGVYPPQARKAYLGTKPLGHGKGGRI